jgi:hypothetical protein
MAAFFMIACFYFKHKLVELNHLRQIENQMRWNLKTKRLSTSSVSGILIDQNNSIKTNEMLRRMMSIIQEDGFIIQTLKPVYISGENRCTINVMLTGPVKQISSLINHLSIDHWVMGIKNISLQIDEYDNTTLELEIFALYDPLKKYPEKMLLPVPIQQLKLVGYIHNTQYFFALLRLPTGEIKTVQRGDIIGLEKGKIIDISENEIIIAVDNHYFHLSKTSTLLELSRG